MSSLKLYRKRFIPQETLLLKDDIILMKTDDVLITKWNVLKPKLNFTNGYSCYFLNEGIKLSRMLDKDSNIVYHYFDIINVIYNELSNSYVFEDLLADIIVHNDGFVRVVDLAEIPDALEEGLIDCETAKKVLRIVDDLLNKIYAGQFYEFKKYIDNIDIVYKG